MTRRADDVPVRPWRRADLAAAHALSAAANWPHRLQDWQFAFDIGVGFVAVAGDRVVGTAVCFQHGEAYATVGLILVSADMQGRGLGRRLTEAVLAAAGARSVMLNATAAGRPLYERLGFRSCGEIRQHHGIVRALPSRPVGGPFRQCDAANQTYLASLDAAASGLQRSILLQRLCAEGSAICLAGDSPAEGFAIVRAFGRGVVIGPVVAPDVERARSLIDHLLEAHIGTFVRLDVPADSGLPAWLEERGLAGAGPATTMVRGALPSPPGPARLFALASQAVG